MRRYAVVIEKAGDGSFGGYVPDLPGCGVCGYKTSAEAKAALAEAIDLHLTKQNEVHFPAVEYARASLAMKIIKSRRAAGWTQAALARRAAIRPESLHRIEKGKTTPDTATIAKIERALEAAATDSE